MGRVVSVSRGDEHTFSKPNHDVIRLLAGLGVEGDAHLGVTVQHRSRVRRDPAQPNLRQVHLIHAELLDEVNASGFAVEAGQLGENITTRGVDLLGLSTGTRLYFSAGAMVEVTGLRNPCLQIEAFHKGLLEQVAYRGEHGDIVRKSGVMSIVLVSGEVRPGDSIRVELPPGPHRRLQPV